MNHPLLNPPTGLGEALPTRLPREGDQAWALFQLFRDMAYPDPSNYARFIPRDEEALADFAGVTRSIVAAFASDFHWYKRASQYDQAMTTALAAAECLGSGDAARARTERLLTKARSLLETELDALLEKAARGSSLSAKDATQLLQLVLRAEKELVVQEGVAGLPQDGEKPWDLSLLSLSDLEVLKRLGRVATGDLPPTAAAE